MEQEGVPSRKGCVANGQMTKTSNKCARPAPAPRPPFLPPPPPSPPPPVSASSPRLHSPELLISKLLCACSDDYNVVKIIEPPPGAAIGALVQVKGWEGEPATPSQLKRTKARDGGCTRYAGIITITMRKRTQRRASPARQKCGRDFLARNEIKEGKGLQKVSVIMLYMQTNSNIL